jgi:cation diffusion facilitator CzcD-associated flavoprotein CzcO
VTANDDPQAPRHLHVAIIGAGFSGLGAAIKLLEAGERDLLLFEAADEVGGVWRDNVYPGCGCDVESPLYSFSFAPNPRWSRMFSPQPEILAYLRELAAEFGVLPFVRFGHAIQAARWDAGERRWLLETSRGRFTADVLIAGMGALHEPVVPSLPGAERFAGRAFHSARWDRDCDLTGKRVAVIGTGASAIQIVPKIQAQVAKLSLFQRTPPWVIPRRDRTFGPVEQRMFEALPLTQKLLRTGIYLRHEAVFVAFRNPKLMRLAERFALAYLAKTVPDPRLRERLRPSFTFGCKRVLLSDDYYPALTQANVELVTAGIREITPTGIVDAEGRAHELDVIIYATGFHVTDPPFAKFVHGRGGRTLAEAWSDGMSAYLGTTVAGFPNMFMLTGPNTGLGHNSMILMIETQLGLIVDALNQLPPGAVLEPRAGVQARYTEELRRAGEGTVWTAGGCSSWYLDERGRNTTLWPWSTLAFMRRVSFDPQDYLIEEHAPH